MPHLFYLHIVLGLNSSDISAYKIVINRKVKKQRICVVLFSGCILYTDNNVADFPWANVRPISETGSYTLLTKSITDGKKTSTMTV